MQNRSGVKTFYLHETGNRRHNKGFLWNKRQLGSKMSIKRGEVEFSPGFQVQNTNGLFAGGEDPEYIAHKWIVFFARWLAGEKPSAIYFRAAPKRNKKHFEVLKGLNGPVLEDKMWIVFTNWRPKMIFSAYPTQINCHFFSCRNLNDNKLKKLPSGIFSGLVSLDRL